MIITTTPTAPYIRAESRLRPEQVNTALVDTAALEADITARVGKYVAVINKKLAGVTTSADNQIIATEALALRILASLYGSAGFLNPVYWQRAQELKKESEDLIDDLLGTSTDDVSGVAGIGNAATLSTAPYGIDDAGILVVNA